MTSLQPSVLEASTLSICPSHLARLRATDIHKHNIFTSGSLSLFTLYTEQSTKIMLRLRSTHVGRTHANSKRYDLLARKLVLL